jgi:hypothetical protein
MDLDPSSYESLYSWIWIEVLYSWIWMQREGLDPPGDWRAVDGRWRWDAALRASGIQD